jgi:hypothetical protein
VLYNANILSFKGAYGLVKFRSLLPNSNWDRIRRLSISTTFLVPKNLSINLFRNRNQGLPPEDYSLWENVCSIMETMHGLQSLFIDMTLWNYRHDYSIPDTIDDDHLITILGPLRNIKARFFEVEMNADVPDRVITALTPFTFKLTERHRPYNTAVFRQG